MFCDFLAEVARVNTARVGNIRSAFKVSVFDVRQNILQINHFFKKQNIESLSSNGTHQSWLHERNVSGCCFIAIFIINNPCSDFIFKYRENEVALSINHKLSCGTDSGDGFISLSLCRMDYRLSIFLFWRIDVIHISLEDVLWMKCVSKFKIQSGRRGWRGGGVGVWVVGWDGDILRIQEDITLEWMTQEIVDSQSTLVQKMLADSTKPLPEPELTKNSDIIWRH